MTLFANIYATQLWNHGHGMPLWTPEPFGSQGEVHIGDVGRIDEDGQFHRMFNVTVSATNALNNGSVPPGFEILQFPEELICTKDDCLEIGPIVSEGVKSRQLSAGASATPFGLPVASAGLNYSFKYEQKQGAILILRSPGKKTNMPRSTDFISYMRRNHEWWCDYALHTLHLKIPPQEIILVRGFVKTSAWALAAYNEDGTRENQVSVSGNLADAAEVHFNHSTSQHSGPTFQHRYGPKPPKLPGHTYVPPSSADDSTASAMEELPEIAVERKRAKSAAVVTPGAVNQCVFLQMYKLKIRFWVWRRIDAAAEPVDLRRSGGSTPSFDGPVRDEGSESEIETESSSLRAQTPLDDLLDYILEESSADVAIACDADVSVLVTGIEWPADFAKYLRQLRPKVDVDETSTGTLSVRDVRDRVFSFASQVSMAATVSRGIRERPQSERRSYPLRKVLQAMHELFGKNKHGRGRPSGSERPSHRGSGSGVASRIVAVTPSVSPPIDPGVQHTQPSTLTSNNHGRAEAHTLDKASKQSSVSNQTTAMPVDAPRPSTPVKSHTDGIATNTVPQIPVPASPVREVDSAIMRPVESLRAPYVPIDDSEYDDDDDNVGSLEEYYGEFLDTRGRASSIFKRLVDAYFIHLNDRAKVPLRNTDRIEPEKVMEYLTERYNIEEAQIIYRNLAEYYDIARVRFQSADGPTGELIPVLDRVGWLRFHIYEVILHPKEVQKFWDLAIRLHNLQDPVTGRRFPVPLPTTCVPAAPDTTTMATLNTFMKRMSQRSTVGLSPAQPNEVITGKPPGKATATKTPRIVPKAVDSDLESLISRPQSPITPSLPQMRLSYTSRTQMELAKMEARRWSNGNARVQGRRQGGRYRATNLAWT